MRICELTPHSFIVEGENVTLLRYVFLTIYRAGDFRSEVFLRERAGRMELLLAYRGRRGTPDIRLHGAILHQSGGGAVSPHRRHSDRSGTASGALVGICFLAGAATVAAWASYRARCDIRPFVAQCCARAIQVFDLAGESGLDRILVPQPPLDLVSLLYSDPTKLHLASTRVQETVRISNRCSGFICRTEAVATTEQVDV